MCSRKNTDRTQRERRGRSNIDVRRMKSGSSKRKMSSEKERGVSLRENSEKKIRKFDLIEERIYEEEDRVQRSDRGERSVA